MVGAAAGIPGWHKGSGVQIPSAPPQVSGPLGRRPPPNRRLGQQIGSNVLWKAGPASGTAVPPASIAGVVVRETWAHPGRAGGPVRDLAAPPGTEGHGPGPAAAGVAHSPRILGLTCGYVGSPKQMACI